MGIVLGFFLVVEKTFTQLAAILLKTGIMQNVNIHMCQSNTLFEQTWYIPQLFDRHQSFSQPYYTATNLNIANYTAESTYIGVVSSFHQNLGVGYQWMVGSISIPGATFCLHVIQTPGIYSYTPSCSYLFAKQDVQHEPKQISLMSDAVKVVHLAAMPTSMAYNWETN